MKSHLTIYILLCVSLYYSCEPQSKAPAAQPLHKSQIENLRADHLNIWTKDPQAAKQRLMDIGFTGVPDSLSAVHEGQGTAGRYFRFLNSYLELIYVDDESVFAQNNVQNPKMDFQERATHEEHGASPFSVALSLYDYAPEKIPFPVIGYHQKWMNPHDSIYAAKSSKANLQEPSVFVVYPELESDDFDTPADLLQIPEEYAIWREYYKHPNGAKELTQIKITSQNLELNSATMRAINDMEQVTIQHGDEHLIELTFDHNEQNQRFDLRPDLPLIIYL